MMLGVICLLQHTKIPEPEEIRTLLIWKFQTFHQGKRIRDFHHCSREWVRACAAVVFNFFRSGGASCDAAVELDVGVILRFIGGEIEDSAGGRCCFSCYVFYQMLLTLGDIFAASHGF